MTEIRMVDLERQYERIRPEIDEAVLRSIRSTNFIKGPEVAEFEESLARYLNCDHVIACANGTDALQIALMALGLGRRDEVIIPAFTYVATAEVIALLGLRPVMVDVDPRTFNVTAEAIEEAVTERTKAIVPVHLFGQSCDMDAIMSLADRHGLAVIEDNAQAIGADYSGPKFKGKTGTLGTIGCTSFFPSKNLGCYGDGGAIFSNDEALAGSIRMIANHGQAKKYYHSVIGVNSRLDTIQAAILLVKLRYLDEYCQARATAAERYDEALGGVSGLSTPVRQPNSTHVFHQYTLVVKDGRRDALKMHLADQGIPSMIYYPLPLYKQEAFRSYAPDGFHLPVTEQLCDSVLSLPIHTEMTSGEQDRIIDGVIGFCSEEL